MTAMATTGAATAMKTISRGRKKRWPLISKECEDAIKMLWHEGKRFNVITEEIFQAGYRKDDGEPLSSREICEVALRSGLRRNAKTQSDEDPSEEPPAAEEKDPRYRGLKSWKPGQSGNPRGRPKHVKVYAPEAESVGGEDITDAIRTILALKGLSDKKKMLVITALV